ncbi:hypothetical protein AAMO2058_000934700 [Amorphochlora amoebiformis]
MSKTRRHMASAKFPAIPVPRRGSRTISLRNRKGKGGNFQPKIYKKGMPSAFSNPTTSQARSIIDLMDRVSELRQRIDRKSFLKIFARTLKDRLNSSDYQRVARMLRAQGIRLPGISRRRSKGGKIVNPGLKIKFKQNKLTIPTPRRSPRLSPRTPVLANALVNLGKQFSSDGFQIPASPGLAVHTDIASSKSKSMRRPPPIPVPLLELGRRTVPVRRSPRFTPLQDTKDLVDDPNLLGAAWDNPIKRRLDFPSPVPLQKPRKPGMPRVAVIRSKPNRKKRRRTLTRKGASHASQTRGTPESSQSTAAVLAADGPMSPGRKYLLRSFIAPVSPLLRH